MRGLRVTTSWEACWRAISLADARGVAGEEGVAAVGPEKAAHPGEAQVVNAAMTWARAGRRDVPVPATPRPSGMPIVLPVVPPTAQERSDEVRGETTRATMVAPDLIEARRGMVAAPDLTEAMRVMVAAPDPVEARRVMTIVDRTGGEPLQGAAGDEACGPSRRLDESWGLDAS